MSRRARRAAMAVAVLGALATACARGDAARAPAGAPPRFAFGSPADSVLITRLDHDARPDGHGLPPGQGSAAQGAAIYTARCAACHGRSGSEGPAPALVGGDAWGNDGPPAVQTIGNYWPYATTLYDYIGRAMPQNAPGSLTPNETYAVIAWLLARNGIVASDAVLDSAKLVAIRMPARDRFVRDDRTGGPEVR